MRSFRFQSCSALLVFVLSMLLLFAPALSAQTRPIVRPSVRTVTITNGVGAQTNQTNITITPNDANGNPIPFQIIDVWMSDQVNGGVTATASSGTTGMIGAAGGVTLSVGFIIGVTQATPSVATSRIPIRVMTDSTGSVVVGVLDSAKTLYVPVVSVAMQDAVGRTAQGLVSGTKLTAASYK